MPFPLIAGFDLLDDRSAKLYKRRRINADKNFKSLFRFERQNIDFLVTSFLDEYHETRGGAISNKQKLMSFLRYIGDPGFQV